MITQLTPTSNFQLSAVGVGVIALGLADIRQCIDFILRTIPGSDPLRPLFGCDIYKYVDNPITTGVPNMKKAIFEAIELWEPRIKVTSIVHEINIEQILFSITYQVVDGDMIDTLSWSINGNNIGSNTGLILSASIPTKVSIGRYNITLNVNKDSVYPLPPKFGFANATDLLVWVKDNWGAYGKWYLTSNKIVLYFGGFSVYSANMLVTQTSMLTMSTDIPILDTGSFYNLSFLIDDNMPTPIFPIETINTIEQLLIWLTINWSSYGSWYVNNTNVFIGGDFNNDFNADFDIGESTPGRNLMFQTNLFSTASLDFI
ncbi:GPW/gp25 family protein [Pedobacter sp. Hv1]|uniref:GPW/gp25 family protein n=1 Tax=Pedobacter sp. Hv1 TaxID=1740090 RepID=UPI0006D8A040|nr:GPW/gp25 family protein [Pedobacter sp. Hv1]KQC02104.1 hypothetical protein AQF98_00585 [Pedobacter sp. Hv1]